MDEKGKEKFNFLKKACKGEHAFRFQQVNIAPVAEELDRIVRDIQSRLLSEAENMKKTDPVDEFDKMTSKLISFV